MNSEELKKEFGLLMPSEINGFKRPDESISSSNDFFLEIPQLISKDPVLYSTMNLIFSVILSNDKLLKQWRDTLQNVVNAQDWRVVTDSLKGYMTPELKKKLDGIAIGANNYVHPSAHPATMITQDATHRFVSDTEKSTWNAKASTAVVSTTANGLAPKRDGNASHFLAGDGTWKVVPSASSAATATKATQDSRGQQIDTTYIKSITASNATITATKGNGTTSNITINNVAHATNSDNSTKATQDSAGQTINTTYVKAVTASNATITVTKGNGSTSTATVNNVSNATNAAYSTTQGTGDNSTRIATTAFVKNNFIEILKKVYPVGAIYTSTVSTSPATLFGFGTWEQIQGRFLLGVSSSHGAGTTGGAETVTLTTAQLPSHNHSGSTGSAGNHNHSASSSNVNISGTFGTGNTTPNIHFKGDTSGCFYNTGSTGNDGTNQPHYTQDDRTQKIGINNTHSHTITINNNGTHTHTVSIGNTGSGQAHTNMPPYVAVYIWKRKA